MKPLLTIITLIFIISSGQAQDPNPQKSADQVIFAFGGDINKPFINYIAGLTGLPKPKVCYVPSASADNVHNINFFYDACHDLSLEPHVLRVWVSSADDNRSFEEILTGMDAIVIGGGNTLNMMAIWKAQGIDTVLQKCLQKGIVLAGGSAGMICWFNNGISDSRPKELSLVEGLSFLDFSSCPHYSEGEARKKLYQNKILDGTVNPGYGCDYYAGILFINGRYVKSVSLSEKFNSWYVSLENGKVIENKLVSEIIK
ncbi:MAG: peptidase E [Bacteroidetes bacterium GWF2_49_14]|nr:MAG: peptidase E [Bacteroidetes bacterium GWF2_49_14]HBB93093.1 peptidase E [Bacteroidales bacterium]